LAGHKGFYSLNDLCVLLQTTTDLSLRKQVVEAMTTNETFFFREATQYDALKSTILPELLQERQMTRRISVWSAAASTGQEAYSLAMLLLEMGLANWNISIVGTDLSDAVLQRARAGKYLQIEVNGVAGSAPGEVFQAGRSGVAVEGGSPAHGAL